MSVETIPAGARARTTSIVPGWLKSVLLIRESSVGTVGAFIVLFWVIIALTAPFLAPYDPNQNIFEAGVAAPPSAAHWAGTDAFGRDILSRIIWGGRISLAVGFLSVSIAFCHSRSRS